MEFRILGPLEVVADGRSLDLGGPKQRALLAILVIEANRVVSSDRLVDALWGERPPDTAQKALRVYVTHLRKALGKERVQTKAPGYALQVEADELDLQRFERLRAEGKLHEALALWRGPPLADFAYERFAAAEVARLDELRVACIEERIDRDLERGLHASLVGELEGLVQAHPLRERLRGQLMLALYRSGRQAEALEAYQDARRALVDGLGLEPGRALRELERAILAQDEALDVVAGAERDLSGRGAFVGRGRELAELMRGLDDAIAGRGGVSLLVGEPGIGKSRLAEELLREARGRGALVLVGRSWEAGGAPAYWPWLQALRAYIEDADPTALRAQLGAGAAELAGILPELRTLFPDLPEPASLDPESARFRLFDATSRFLRGAADTRPVVLFLDDLHAADGSSLLLLQFLARGIGSSRLFVLAALRDVDPVPEPFLSSVLAELAREPTTRRVSLEGLRAEAVADYVEHAAVDLAAPELVAALHEETEGNPLFLGEIVRLVAVEGMEPRDVRRVLPESVRDVIRRRLVHLSTECNRVLELASVLGREFDLEVLGRLAGLPEDEVLDLLDEAMLARVVSDVPDAPRSLRFSHVLVRDTLYEGPTSARRALLHRRALEALEALYGDEPGARLAELAHHAVAARDTSRGVEYARRAGDYALEVLAYEEAARLYALALDALAASGPLDERVRCELLLALGEAQIRAGDSAVAKETFVEAAAVARRLGFARELALAAAGYGGRIVFARTGHDERLVPLLEEGLALLGDGDPGLRARLLARLAGALRDEHSRERRDALSAEAIELARRGGEATLLAYALDARAHAVIAPDTIAECLELAEQLRTAATLSGDPERVISAHELRFLAELVRGNVGAAEAALAAASRIAAELGQPAQLWLVRNSESLLALATGRLDEAETIMAEAILLGRRAQPDVAGPVHLLQQCTLRDFRGGLEEVEPALRRLVDDQPRRPVFRCALAHLEAQLGRTPDATLALHELGEDEFAALPFDQEWLFAMSFLAETAALVGDADSAAVLYRLLEPWEAYVAVDVGEGFRGSVARYLGFLAMTSGHPREARAHFDAALAANAEMGALPWLAFTQHDYAGLLLAAGRSTDRVRGAELLADALATYRELGMEVHAARAAAARPV